MNTSRSFPVRAPARFGLAALTLAAAAACSDPGAPNPTSFDAEALTHSHQALASVLGSPAMLSFEALGARIRPGGLFGSSSAASVEGGVATAAWAALAPDRPATVPVISDAARGKTFVYDPAEDRYVPDETATGAPANGVRFILYAVDPVTKRPIVGQETGHADLFDLGDDTPNGPSLRFVVTHGGQLVLDYHVAASGTETTGRVDIVGSMGGDSERLAFEIHSTGTREGERASGEVAFTLGMDARAFSVDAEVGNTRDPGGNAGSVELDVRHGEHSIGVRLASTPSAVEGSFTVNGNPLATVSGEPGSPKIVGARGEPLSPQEAQALGHIMQTQQHVFQLLERLVQPAGDIVKMGFVL